MEYGSVTELLCKVLLAIITKKRGEQIPPQLSWGPSFSSGLEFVDEDNGRLCEPAEGCCGCDADLHQMGAIALWRDNEDGPGLATISSREGVKIKKLEASDIPGRRDVLYVVFECEGRGIYVMEIAQHKGSTYCCWPKHLNPFTSKAVPWWEGIEKVKE